MDCSNSGNLTNAPSTRSDLPFWVWAIVPLAIWLIAAPLALLSPKFSKLLFRLDIDGGGPVEHGTVLILLPGIAAGISVFVKALRNGHMRLERFWYLFWALACIYFAGEETSWGQHFFHWSTPDALESLNDQQETNLHNISSWLDQKPRALVEAWMLIGGLITPLCICFRKTQFAPTSWQHWILPTIVCAPAVIGGLLTRVFEVIDNNTESHTFSYLGNAEFRELFIALFLTIYLLSAWYRFNLLQPGALGRHEARS